MTLGEYLERIGVGVQDFSKSSGIPRGSLDRLLRGQGCTARTAERLIQATHGAVSLGDITGSAQGLFQPGVPGGKSSSPAEERGL